MNRVIILGIDALEYNIVERLDLDYLKQKEYGKTIVPITEGWKEPATVIVWPCFITGCRPKEMGYNAPILFKQPLQFLLDKMVFPLRNFMYKTKYVDNVEQKKLSQDVVNIFKDITKRSKFARHPERKDIKASTLFDNSFKSKHCYIPVYDISMDTLARWDIFDAMDNPKIAYEFKTKYRKEIIDKKEELFELLEKDYELIMMYWYCLDGIQHALFKDRVTIDEFYIRFNSTVKEIRDRISKDDLLLIISDHGQEKGIHTPYGFYSCNQELGLNKPHICDFKKIIEERLENDNIKNPSKN